MIKRGYLSVNLLGSKERNNTNITFNVKLFLYKAFVCGPILPARDKCLGFFNLFKVNLDVDVKIKSKNVSRVPLDLIIKGIFGIVGYTSEVILGKSRLTSYVKHCNCLIKSDIRSLPTYVNIVFIKLFIKIITECENNK